MRSGGGAAAGTGALALWPLLALLAASSTAAQQVREVGVQAIGTASDPGLAALGGYAALRTSLRTRISLGAAVGTSDGQVAGRGELLAHFLLSPSRRNGVGVYGAGGIAGLVGAVDQGYVVLTLGLESRPGAPSGWFVEGGVGGGARLAAGWRWRWFPAGWPIY